jgi:hypothetical protein
MNQRTRAYLPKNCGATLNFASYAAAGIEVRKESGRERPLKGLLLSYVLSGHGPNVK